MKISFNLPILVVALVMVTLQLVGCNYMEDREVVATTPLDSPVLANENVELSTMTANLFGFGTCINSGELENLMLQMVDDEGEHLGFVVAFVEDIVNSESESIALWKYLTEATLMQIKYDGIIHNTTPLSIYAQEVTVLERESTFGMSEYLKEAFPDEYSVFFDAHRDLMYGEGYSANRNVSDNLYRTITGHFSELDWNLPDFWGGHYIDDQGRLVVQVATDFLPMDEAMDYLSDIVDVEPIIFHPVEFSENQLRDLLDNYLIHHPYIRDFVHGLIFHNIPKNRVEASLMNYSDEETERFREVIIDSPMIIFTQDPYFVQ